MQARRTDVPLTEAQANSILSPWFGRDVRCLHVERLHGGMMNSVLRLRFDRPPFSAVLKLNPDPGHEGFADEARRLTHLRENTSLPCPEVYGYGPPSDKSPWPFLLMEELPGTCLLHVTLEPDARRAVDHELALALLGLHAHTRGTFGRIDQDPGTPTWSEIVLGRLGDMRQEMETMLPRSVLRDIDHALKRAGEAMAPQGLPSLIHGDVWAGNIVVVRRDDGWHLSGLVDPGPEYADVEQELAYLEVFDTVGPTFFEIYTAQTPRRPGYAFRRLFHWLNTYMVHVWIFGDQGYRDRVASIAAEIARA